MQFQMNWLRRLPITGIGRDNAVKRMQ